MAESELSENGAEIYLSDLADIQTYLERLQQLLTECSQAAMFY